jgi:hypothetical protein
MYFILSSPEKLVLSHTPQTTGLKIHMTNLFRSCLDTLSGVIRCGLMFYRASDFPRARYTSIAFSKNIKSHTGGIEIK